MQNVSERWKEEQRQNIVPNSFVEIVYKVSDDEALDWAYVTTNGHEELSRISKIISTDGSKDYPNALLETNQWILDGKHKIITTFLSYTGYMSLDFSDGYALFTDPFPTVTISLAQNATKLIPGITIIWDYAGYERAYAFDVNVYRGSTLVNSVSILENDDSTCFVPMEISNYNKIEIVVKEWSLPASRAKIDKVILGQIKTFNNDNLVSFSHEQSSDLLSMELPVNEIKFEVDNTLGEWNPDDPQGIYEYITEGQTVTARYGFNVDGEIEWIKCGTFYLTDWEVPQNGFTATFTAGDALTQMNVPFFDSDSDPTFTGTLYDMAEQAFLKCGIDNYSIDGSLTDFTISATPADIKYNCNEIVQLCANASMCVVYVNADGTVVIEPHNYQTSDYEIDEFVSYRRAEYEFIPKLKSVNVNDGQAVVDLADTGEVQTIDNKLIQDNSQAVDVANWIASVLLNRKNLNGEYRPDIRLNALDGIVVTNKYGTNPVVITRVKCDYEGCFHGTYEGKVM